jgi:hypothetical protein
MKAVLHIFLKDLRRFRVMASLAVAFEVIDTFRPYSVTWSDMQAAWLSVVSVGGSAVVAYLLAVVLIQSDLTVGDRGFWRTRPIAPVTLFASKTAFIFAVLVIPRVVCEVCLTRLMRAPWNLTGAVMVEAVVSILAITLAAAVMGSVTRTLLQALAATAGAALSFVVIMMGLASLAESWGFSFPWGTNGAVSGSRIDATELYLSLGLAAALGLQIRMKKSARTVALVSLSLALAMTLALRWPLRIGPEPAPGPVPTLVGPPDLQVLMQSPIEAGRLDTIKDPSTKLDVPARSISMDLTLRNAPKGTIIKLESITSSLRTHGAGEVMLPSTARQYWPDWNWSIERESICSALDLSPPPPDKAIVDTRRLDLFDIPIGKAAPFEHSPSTYAGALKFSETAFEVEARLPADGSAPAVEPGEAWVVDRADFSEKGAGLQLRFLFVTSALMPGREGIPAARQQRLHGFVLRNRSRGEYALARENYGSWDNSSGSLWVLKRFALFNRAFRDDGTPVRAPIDRDWVLGAELTVLSSRIVGTFEKRVALEGFVLPDVGAGAHSEIPAFWQ